jgi:hypothetical protein
MLYAYVLFCTVKHYVDRDNTVIEEQIYRIGVNYKEDI